MMQEIEKLTHWHTLTANTRLTLSEDISYFDCCQTSPGEGRNSSFTGQRMHMKHNKVL